MRYIFPLTILLFSFAACKTLHIEGTPTVRVTNNSSESIPVTVENAPDVQKVEVVATNAKKGKPFVKTSNNDKPLELIASKGHYLIVDYLSAGIPSADLPKLTIQTEGFTIDLPLQVRGAYYTYAERVQYIVLEGQKLTISTTRKGQPGSYANIYVAGNEMAAD
ncbi:MAG: hypothetical protein EOP51_16765 [Sphingobacteriales bacterium]|nr:MAG: hypothetical protein EOP51_16765 [Sphingobacteriales bacterium]